MILLIDNYDSFTWNLVHLVYEIEAKVTVHRNDEISADDALALQPEAIILSPGPCTPDQAGICLELVTKAAEQHLPLFGVCLGHQSIAQAFGATITRAGRLMHGKTSQVQHNQNPLFAGIPDTFTAARYHSLVADPATFDDRIEPLAHATDDGEIMAIRIKDKPVYGVQFHPESIASEYGLTLIRNFLAVTASERSAA